MERTLPDKHQAAVLLLGALLVGAMILLGLSPYVIAIVGFVATFIALLVVSR